MTRHASNKQNNLIRGITREQYSAQIALSTCIPLYLTFKRAEIPGKIIKSDCKTAFSIWCLKDTQSWKCEDLGEGQESKESKISMP